LSLDWLGISLPQTPAQPQKSQLFDDGGYAVLHKQNALVLFRYPRFKFRPSQADALHVDLWLQGENLLRDSGSYSYNTEKKWLDYFPCSVSHNTIQFDDKSQMPRISRFLYGDWLKTKELSPIVDSDEYISVGASYVDRYGAQHARTLRLHGFKLTIEDKIEGFKNLAVLRWRLKPGDWQVTGHTIKHKAHTLSVQSTAAIKRFEIIEGWESRYYLDKQPIPVLEIEIHEAGTITTECQWD